jgi:DnaD/phage-associated family protein
MNIVNLLASDNYIVVNKDLIKEFGINTALMLGELASEYQYYYKNNMLENGMFFSTIENIEENTGLSKHQQKKALEELKSMGIIDVVVKGLPAKRYIKIDINILANKFANNLQTSSEKISKQEGKKVAGNNNNKIILNNNNKEDNNYSYSYKETLFELIENNIGRTLNSIEIELIRTWEDNDLTRYIIKQCILNQKYNIKYIDRVITSTKLKGIKTVVDFEKESETFKQQKQTKVKKTETFSEKLKRLQEEAKNEEKEKK